MRDFATAVQEAPLPQLPRDLPPPHPVWGEVAPPASNAARQALLQLLLSAGAAPGCRSSCFRLLERGCMQPHQASHASTRRTCNLRGLQVHLPPAPCSPAEVERLAAWADPLEAAGVPLSAAASLTPAQWAQHLRTAWAEVSPALAVAMARRFPGASAIRTELQRLVAEGAGEPAVQGLPEAAPLLATPAAAKANAPQLQHLAVWAPLPLLEAIELAAGPAGRQPAVLAFVMRSLQACRPEEVAFFLPQLVQVRQARRVQGALHRAGKCRAVLRHATVVWPAAARVYAPPRIPASLPSPRFQLLRDDPGSTVERFLLDAASHSVYFAHMLVCQLLSEGTPPDEAFNPTVRKWGWGVGAGGLF